MTWKVKPCASTGNIASLFHFHYWNLLIDDFYKINDLVCFIGSSGGKSLVKGVSEVLRHLLGFCSFLEKLWEKSR